MCIAMLFQNEFFLRLIAASLLQTWSILYLSYFAYKLLKRAKNRSTYTLSAYFITTALAYFLANISIFLVNTPFAYILYMISSYIFVFSFSFLINFAWLLTRLGEEKSNHTKLYLRITVYAILSIYVIIIGIPFNGVTLNASTGWVPNFKWFFLVFNWIYFLIFLIIPQIFFSVKILKVYKGIVIKKRLNLFIISGFLTLSMAVSLFLYHAWTENIFYKTFHILIGLVLGIYTSYLLYKGFLKELVY